MANHSRAQRSANATNRSAASSLQYGAVYSGVVVFEKDGLYNVRLNAPRKSITGVRLASAVLGGLLGFNVRQKLSRGTPVLLVHDVTPFIFCVNSITKTKQIRARTATGYKFKQEVVDTDGPPADMVAGEFEISNLMGVAMQFLTTLMRMTAGDRASVEVHLLNDMVRIVSGQFRHISPLGEELMFDHGRPTMERTWTSYRHELFNKTKTTEPLSEKDGDDMKTDTAKRMTDVGRHRLLEFIGFAGDFIHSFVTDPSAAAMQLSEEAQDSAGKSWIHRNSDGSVLIQSVADIALERVTRIPVPFRINPHESHEAAAERNYDNLNAEFVKYFSNGSSDSKHAYRNAYQLRAYARWLSRFHAFARVAQLDKDYAIKSEQQSAAPQPGNREVDRKNAPLYVEAYACIRIMRDGSISMLDGYGSSVTLANGNVSVSAARHLDLEAAGDIRMTAGGNIFAKARRSIELSASEGGLLLHGLAFVGMLCERGTAWIRSNADTETEDPPQPVQEGGIVPDIASVEGEKYAVLIEAPKGRSLVRTKHRQAYATDHKPQNAEDRTANIIFNTAGDFETNSRNFATYVKENLTQTVGKSWAFVADTIYGRFSEWLAGGVSIANGVLRARSMSARQVEANNFYGDEIGPVLPPTAAESVAKHFNHIGTRLATGPVPLPTPTNQETVALLGAAVNIRSDSTWRLVTWTAESQGPTFGFLPAAEYYWDSREEIAGALVESPTQQQIRIDVGSGDPWGGPGYDNWIVRDVDDAPRMGRKKSFGAEAKHFTSNTGESLHLPSATEIANIPTSADWQLTQRGFLTLKRS